METAHSNRISSHLAEPTQEQRPHAQGVNMNDFDRLASGLAGLALAAYGLGRRSLDGIGLALVGGALLQRGWTGHCHGYDALGIDTTSGRPEPTSVRAGAGIKVETSLTINRSVDELYRFWRDLDNLSRVMSHLESVRQTGPMHSHWVARGPFGMRVEWDAEIINEEQNRLIAWRSLEGSAVATAGSVHFEPAPGNRGTIVRVTLKYDPPAGKAGALIARLFGQNPEHYIREDLRRWKQALETGETATTLGQTSCRH